METNNLSVKSNLFRFVTFRSADTIPYHKRQGLFIYHPDISKSVLANKPLGTVPDTPPADDTSATNTSSGGTKPGLNNQ